MESKLGKAAAWAGIVAIPITLATWLLPRTSPSVGDFPSQPLPQPSMLSIDHAYIQLYDDHDFGDRCLTIRYPKAVTDMNHATSDDGELGYDGKATSVQWLVPKGYKAILWENNSFGGRRYELPGTGVMQSLSNLGGFGGKTSSVSWEKETDKDDDAPPAGAGGAEQ